MNVDDSLFYYLNILFKKNGAYIYTMHSRVDFATLLKLINFLRIKYN